MMKSYLLCHLLNILLSPASNLHDFTSRLPNELSLSPAVDRHKVVVESPSRVFVRISPTFPELSTSLDNRILDVLAGHSQEPFSCCTIILGL